MNFLLGWPIFRGYVKLLRVIQFWGPRIPRVCFFFIIGLQKKCLQKTSTQKTTTMTYRGFTRVEIKQKKHLTSSMLKSMVSVGKYTIHGSYWTTTQWPNTSQSTPITPTTHDNHLPTFHPFSEEQSQAIKGSSTQELPPMLSMQLKMDNELYKMENLHLSCQSYFPNPPGWGFFLLVGGFNPFKKY